MELKNKGGLEEFEKRFNAQEGKEYKEDGHSKIDM